LPRWWRDCANRDVGDARILLQLPTAFICSANDANWRLAMRILLMTMAAASILTFGAQQSEAQYAAQLYPYCSLSSSSGATNCYIRSREECGRNACIQNPWYIGRARATPYLDGRKPLEPHYVRP